VLIGIDAVGDQGARLITSRTGFFEADLRITTERHTLLHARPAVLKRQIFPPRAVTLSASPSVSPSV